MWRLDVWSLCCWIKGFRGNNIGVLIIVLIFLLATSFTVSVFARAQKTDLDTSKSATIKLNGTAIKTRGDFTPLTLLQFPPGHCYVRISEKSWELYMNFKESTCRENDDEYIGNKVLHSMENRYFSWEERMFHIALRSIIFPRNLKGQVTIAPLIGSTLLRTLDPRVFISEPESLCKVDKKDPDEEELNKAEQDRFEDYLINKVFSHPLDF